MMEHNQSNWKTYIMLALATSIWGTAFVGGKIATEDLGPITVAFFRFFGAALLLMAIVSYKKQWPTKISSKDWLLFIVLGLTGIFLYNIAFFIAAKYSPIIKNSLFIGANPVFIVILSGIFLKEAITKNQYIGLLLAVIGVTYIVTNGQFELLLQLRFEWIDLVLMVAVLSWAIYTVVGKVVLQKYSPLIATTYACVIGSVMLFPFMLWESQWNDFIQASAVTWFWIVEMAVIVSVVSFIMYYNGVQKVGAAKASIFINFMPLSAVVMAALFMGEQLTIYHLIGALFIFGGVYLSTIKNKLKKP